ILDPVQIKEKRCFSLSEYMLNDIFKISETNGGSKSDHSLMICFRVFIQYLTGYSFQGNGLILGHFSDLDFFRTAKRTIYPDSRDRNFSCKRINHRFPANEYFLRGCSAILLLHFSMIHGKPEQQHKLFSPFLQLD